MILMTILVLLEISKVFGNSVQEGQDFLGSKYYRDPNRAYTHKRQRKRDAYGKYRYFDEL